MVAKFVIAMEKLKSVTPHDQHKLLDVDGNYSCKLE